jgi:hypothetical protein
MDPSRIDKPEIQSRSGSTASSAREVDPALKSRFLKAFEQSTPVKERVKQNQSVPLYTLLAMSGAQVKGNAALPMQTPPKSEANAELAALLQRACSAMYVGERSATDQRIMLSLDPVLAGASAEIVRNGSSLRIRLLAQTPDAYQTMAAQLRGLIRLVPDREDWQVDLQVIDRDEPRGVDALSRPG